MNLTQEQLQNIIKEELDAVLDEKRKKKRKKKKVKVKKKKGKKDACYHKVRARYDVWPSAYASGALVKCRKVGAKNWGNKSESLNESEGEFEPHMMYDPKTGKSEMTKKLEDHERLAKKGYIHVDPDELRDILDDEGGAAGLEPLVKGTKSSDKEVKAALKDMPDVGKHKKGDYIKADEKEVEIVKEYFMNEATYEDGSPVEEGFEFYENINEAELEEAEYRGRKVKLNKPMRGDVKKFKVFVKDPKTGNVKKVNFGHGGTSAKRKGEKTMKIRKNNPKARKNFRARHNCKNPGPKTKARYWSCRKW